MPSLAPQTIAHALADSPVAQLAPVRFRYDFDNPLLSHKDRSRFVTNEFRTKAATPHGPVLVRLTG